MLEDLYHKLNIHSAWERRLILCTEMLDLEHSGHDCSKCDGNCCSYASNSMRTTPLETIELILYLKKENRLNEDLIKKLTECVRNNRLDYFLDTGSGQNFRRTYTCPFYTPSAKGCSISRAYKPYGCLGFNPTPKGCMSQISLLEMRENKFLEEEKAANEIIKKELKLFDDKLAMPFHILEILRKVKN